MTKTARYAVVTPYYKEPRETLERCIGSVRRQTVKTDHYFISDGFAQDWLDGAGVSHVRLGHAYGDFGNTPRGIGALMAVAERYEAIGFLDADNWLDDDHTEVCIAAGEADAIIAKRRFVRYDGSVMNVAEEPDHVDTSCFWLNQVAFHLAHHWLMPIELAPLCDRVFYGMLKSKKVPLRQTAKATVNYTCQYEALYRAIGEEPPPGAKKTVDIRPVYEWLRDLEPRERNLVALRCGVDLVPQAVQAFAKADRRAVFQVSRNEPCPCGSGRKYKHCHGQISAAE
jgi:hypothetical protein